MTVSPVPGYIAGMGKGKQDQVMRCPYCTRDIHPTSSGHVAEHVTPGNQRCIAVGLAWRVVEHIAANPVRRGR